MKKWTTLSLCLASLLCLVLFATPKANAATYGDLTYEVTNGEVTITGCNQSVTGNLVIPSTINGYSVTTIGHSAFYNCTSLTDITLPDSVTTIGYSAFSGCTSLTDVTIGDSVTTISECMFQDCASLTSITIPDSVTSIGQWAFSNCDSLNSITIGDSVTTIGYAAFQNCISLQSITIPDSITSIGNYAFEGCTSLQYNIYDNGKYLGNANNLYLYLADTVSSEITQCTIHPNTKRIGNYAFSWCTELTNITIPGNVICINEFAFYYCVYLESAIISDGVTTIDDYAFINCASLRSITIPNSVTTIGGSAFKGCNRLTSITIPNSVTGIGYFAFSDCTSLISVTIGESVTDIGESAFYGCKSLTSITIPDSVTTIGSSAFQECASLTNITIGKSITGIDNYAFANCTSLKDVYYTGTQEQWQEISVGESNTCLTDATIHFNWHEHIFTNYVSNNDATYFEDGTKTAKCDYCDATDTIIDEGSRLTPERNEILQQPENVTTDSGETVSFSVKAFGEIVSYQWQYRKIYKWFDTTMEGFDTDTLTLTATGQRNGYDYRCVVTYADGTVMISEPAELTVNTNITVTGNPNDQTAALGTKGQFTAAAEGEGIKYQWQYCRPNSEKWIDTAMEGATKPTVLIETTTARDGYQYRCKITDVTGKVTYTEAATLRVLSIRNHPEDQIALTGKTATFTVQTNVTEGVTYQWQYRRNATANWTNTTMTGYNTASLTVAATKARNGYQYRCVITGAKNGKLTSNAAVLSVSDPVSITAQPENVSAAASGNAVFTIGAANVTAYRWQYSRNGTTWYDTTATGCKTATLTVAAKGKNGYHYRCILTAADGTEIISNSATLTVK